jgi:hypothetical protein
MKNLWESKSHVRTVSQQLSDSPLTHKVTVYVLPSPASFLCVYAQRDGMGTLEHCYCSFFFSNDIWEDSISNLARNSQLLQGTNHDSRSYFLL